MLVRGKDRDLNKRKPSVGVSLGVFGYNLKKANLLAMFEFCL